jgi:hypothetical protein
MKSVKEFLDEVSGYIGAIRHLCKQELSAMVDTFCNNECLVNLHIKQYHRDYRYFEYRLSDEDRIEIQYMNDSYMVEAVMYYADEDEWTLIIKNSNLTADEICLEDYSDTQVIINIIEILKINFIE